MAKKQAIAFALARRTYSNLFEVFEITKESPTSRIVYGRDGDDDYRIESPDCPIHAIRTPARRALAALHPSTPLGARVQAAARAITTTAITIAPAAALAASIYTAWALLYIAA